MLLGKTRASSAIGTSWWPGLSCPGNGGGGARCVVTLQWRMMSARRSESVILATFVSSPSRLCVPMRKASLRWFEMHETTDVENAPFSIWRFQGFSFSGRIQFPGVGTWSGGLVHLLSGRAPGSTTSSVAPIAITSPRNRQYPEASMRVQLELTNVPFEEASRDSRLPSLSSTRPSDVAVRYAWNRDTWSSARRQMGLRRERPTVGNVSSGGMQNIEPTYFPSLTRKWNGGATLLSMPTRNHPSLSSASSRFTSLRAAPLAPETLAACPSPPHSSTAKLAFSPSTAPVPSAATVPLTASPRPAPAAAPFMSP
mmetsp:Transcript_33746/g.79886  ORF Transcript_33746/g.79886 Transcript_33746/m.79886 type:complete len:312 (-) Transcript_33746:179-1114(-)